MMAIIATCWSNGPVEVPISVIESVSIDNVDKGKVELRDGSVLRCNVDEAMRLMSYCAQSHETVSKPKTPRGFIEVYTEDGKEYVNVSQIVAVRDSDRGWAVIEHTACSFIYCMGTTVDEVMEEIANATSDS